MKAIGYVRVSTEDQVSNGVSLAQQRERITAYCTSKGLDLVAMYADNGVSAGKPLSTREGGKAMLTALANGEAQHVVSLKLDRLFRDAIDCLESVKAWDREGVSLHLIDMGGDSLNTGSPTGKCFLTMAAAFAELERGLCRERVRQALAHKKAHLQAYARTPIGYSREGNTLAEDPGELATVSRIQALRLEGVSYSSIAATFNAENVPTKRGGKWFASTVRYIALNTLYQVA